MMGVGRPRKHHTPEAKAEANRIQTAEFGARRRAKRKEIRASLDAGERMCSHKWCIHPAKSGEKFCETHASPKKCLYCEGEAMPGKQLCGYHDEEYEDV